MNLTEKASYIKGLAEGMEINGSDKTGKLILALIDVIDDMALTVSDLEDEVVALTEQLDAVDEDLAMLEDDFYEEYDEDDDEDWDDDDEYYYDDDEQFFEVECPECHDNIILDEEMLSEGSIKCPNCKTEIEFELDEDEDEQE